LFLTVGYFRWSRILTGRATIREWRPDQDQGTDWYRRAMRAHANCLENLPIYTVVVIALLVTETKSPWLDGLAIILLIAHIAHNPRYILAPRRRSSSQVYGLASTRFRSPA
jgi:uncharacterized MAPEG superfamily protein